MKIGEILQFLESFAPPALQESYDNAGLLTGDRTWECTGILTALDALPAVIEEAIHNNCNLVVVHHPVIFKGLKKINGKNYVERTVILAIKNDIAIYAIHTNLDNVKNGVNIKIAEKLGMVDTQILQLREHQLKKLITFAPLDQAENLRRALFDAGAGQLGKYSECSFSQEGTGTFKPLEGSDPFVGETGKRHVDKEVKIEVIFPSYLESKIIPEMIKAHPYEEVAYDVISLGNFLSDIGSGMIGNLPAPVPEKEFLATLKNAFKLQVIRHTGLRGKPVLKVAICGGAGSFLLPEALSQKADIYLTSDIKYHEFFDAESKLVLVDIGHYESEQFTIDLLHDILREKFINFAVRKTDLNTNPVHYFL
ncbi:MAG: Nif3-like dinuclear metal center hexameric protein [Ginsengibacter sp.]